MSDKSVFRGDGQALLQRIVVEKEPLKKDANDKENGNGIYSYVVHGGAFRCDHAVGEFGMEYLMPKDPDKPFTGSHTWGRLCLFPEDSHGVTIADKAVLTVEDRNPIRNFGPSGGCRHGDDCHKWRQFPEPWDNPISTTLIGPGTHEALCCGAKIKCVRKDLKEGQVTVVYHGQGPMYIAECERETGPQEFVCRKGADGKPSIELVNMTSFDNNYTYQDLANQFLGINEQLRPGDSVHIPDGNPYYTGGSTEAEENQAKLDRAANLAQNDKKLQDNITSTRAATKDREVKDAEERKQAQADIAAGKDHYAPYPLPATNRGDSSSTPVYMPPPVSPSDQGDNHNK